MQATAHVVRVGPVHATLPWRPRVECETQVGFIGLGERGAPMAMQILEAGWPLTVYARRAVALEPFAERARIAASVSALAAACDVVCVCVVDDAGVEDVLVRQGLLEGMRPGGTVVINATVTPEVCRRM